jgi:hypothetical protein
VVLWRRLDLLLAKGSVQIVVFGASFQLLLPVHNMMCTPWSFTGAPR